MTGIMIGFTRARQRLGTVYGNYSLTSIDTGINAAGPNGDGSGNSTITLPATPSTNQTITINNVGTGLVSFVPALPDPLPAGVSGHFKWDGYTWGVWFSDCSASVLNATHDFGTTTQGPAETPYSVPPNTVVYSSWWTNTCGETVRKVVTTTYEGRNTANQWKAVATWYNPNYPSWTPSYNSGAVTSYGSTEELAIVANGSAVSGQIPTTITYQPNPTIYGYSPSFARPNPTRFDYSRSDIPPPYVSPLIQVVGGNPVTSQLTLYYLDTHITWTYETL